MGVEQIRGIQGASLDVKSSESNINIASNHTPGLTPEQEEEIIRHYKQTKTSISPNEIKKIFGHDLNLQTLLSIINKVYPKN